MWLPIVLLFGLCVIVWIPLAQKEMSQTRAVQVILSAIYAAAGLIALEIVFVYLVYSGWPR